MPRDGSGQYHMPPGTPGVPNTTIASAKYNSFVSDVELDLNTPRPIVAGGTGATSASTALTSLGGEFAEQVVTNYDSMVFQPGSFYSAATATSPPVAGNACSGICYVTDANNMTIEARDSVTGLKYVRIMTAGVWSSWRADGGAGAMSSGLWTFASTLTFPPGNGQIRLNNVTQNLATHVFISHLTAFGANVTQQLKYMLQAGGSLYLQEANNATDWITFDVTSVAFTGGDADVTVVFREAGSALAANASCQLSIMPPTGNVRYDIAQTPTLAQQTQARQNIYAAPFDAMAYNGMQINGAFEVGQYYGIPGGAAALPNGRSYLPDQWNLNKNHATAVFNLNQSPGTGVTGGMQTSFVITATTAAASYAAGEYVMIEHPIEGSRWQRLAWGTANAQPVTIAFWVYAAVAGTMAVQVGNPAGNRGYVADVPLSAGVWQYKTVTIPGDTIGTWPVTTALGASVHFCFGSGSTYNGAPPNVWGTTLSFATANTTNFFPAANNNVYLQGVLILPGSAAPSAVQSMFCQRTIDQELALCKRYYEVGTGPLSYLPFAVSVSGAYDTIRFMVEKASAPSSVAFGGTWQYYSGGSPAVFTPTLLGGLSRYHFSFSGSGLVNWSGWSAYGGTWLANARLI